MNIFISHSNQDTNICKKLAKELIEIGYVVSISSGVSGVNSGQSIFEAIKTALNNTDIFVAIVTENYLNSSVAQSELSAAILGITNIRVLPIVVGNVFVPDFLIGYQYRKVDSLEEVVRAVLKDVELLGKAIDSTASPVTEITSTRKNKDSIEEKICLLKKAC